MRIMVIYEECNNAELLEKMRQVKSFEDYQAIIDSGIYDRDECADAFAAVNGEYMGEEDMYDDLYSAYFNYLDAEIIDILEYRDYQQNASH
jgi:hypothetical protein